LQTVHAGHADIADNHVRLLAVHALQHGFRILKALALDARLHQSALEHPAYRLVIVNDPDGTCFA
jgi:hypothetical protein